MTHAERALLLIMAKSYAGYLPTYIVKDLWAAIAAVQAEVVHVEPKPCASSCDEEDKDSLMREWAALADGTLFETTSTDEETEND